MLKGETVHRGQNQFGLCAVNMILAFGCSFKWLVEELQCLALSSRFNFM